MAMTQATPGLVVLSKLTYGFNPNDLAQFNSMGLNAWLADQLNPNKTENPRVSAGLKAFPSLSMSPEDTKNNFPYSIKNYLVADEVILSTLFRRTWSDRQLFEMLVEFFHDLIPSPRGVADENLSHYDTSVLRKYALGNYPDMLVASSRSAAMLASLNGNQNDKNNPNENYGRELLELFTVSTAAPYNQTDVVNAARVLSGISWWADSGKGLQASPGRHWNGPVTVLGWSDPNPGGSSKVILDTAERMIRYLALLPATARAFSLRLARRFVSDTPPESLVSGMAGVYLETSGNIPAVVTFMAQSAEFAASDGQKIKRPTEFVSSIFRALGISPAKEIMAGDPMKDNFFAGNPLQRLHQWSIDHGHAPYGWPFPNGYPDTGAAWTTLSSQVMRWNLVRQLSYGWGNGDFTTPNYSTLLHSTKTSDSSILNSAAALLLGRRLENLEQAAALKVVSNVGGKNANDTFERKAQVAVGIVLSAPDWNLR
jgi:hypothetical protein